MHVILTQHPVGQGGLFSGALECAINKLRWVYDCGSNHPEPLYREIENVAQGGPIDILFLSHLDSDHVDGIDRLILSADVDEVVMPYLNELDRSLLICRDLDGRRVNGQFLEFARNPVKWLTSRGVRKITFIHGDDGEGDAEGGGDSPEAPMAPEHRGKLRLTRKWSREPLHEYEMRGAQVREFDTKAAVYILGDGRVLNWILAPFAHRPPDVRLKDFRKALDGAFGKHTSVRSVTEHAKTEEGRRKLRACYDIIWSDHNLVSMALYAGPVIPHEWDLIDWSGLGFGPSNDEIGWLSSGDANLRGANRRNSLLRHYQRFLPQIAALVLPHHGAVSSFHADLLSGFPSLRVGLAASGPNSYGHPHLAVEAAVRARPNADFHKVGRKPSTRFWVAAQT